MREEILRVREKIARRDGNGNKYVFPRRSLLYSTHTGYTEHQTNLNMFLWPVTQYLQHMSCIQYSDVQSSTMKHDIYTVYTSE